MVEPPKENGQRRDAKSRSLVPFTLNQRYRKEIKISCEVGTTFSLILGVCVLLRV
jgi:hypothetical protein